MLQKDSYAGVRRLISVEGRMKTLGNLSMNLLAWLLHIDSKKPFPESLHQSLTGSLDRGRKFNLDCGDVSLSFLWPW